ncbi:hypothetical protein B0A50_04347 [Salinomyces thailandicus]|uniref:Uncharacterized protein n=1 Tax=Salinomyces thailandicus TaxID=706561 RepID=A0A4U0TYL8_9PEZI|nr:hypothetical protein B0A50_04347 [Salinomyces thailandica]
MPLHGNLTEPPSQPRDLVKQTTSVPADFAALPNELLDLILAELPKESRARFEQFLRRDAYNAALKEGPTPRLLLNREFSDRHCSASLRRIDICEHESVNLGEIKKLARDAARDFITLSTDSFSSSSARCVQYTCPHRAHVQSENWPSEMQQPSMTIKLDANGLPEEVTVHAHVFVSGMNTRRRHDYTSLACALETNNSAPSQELL